jgi:hypothetical protein
MGTKGRSFSTGGNSVGFGVGVYEYDYKHATRVRWDSTDSLYALDVRSNELSLVDRINN